MEYSPDTCACFTGHRAMTDEELKSSALLVSEQIKTLYAKGIRNYYAGGAIGFDLAAAVTVLNMKRVYPDITLNLALPCPEYQSKWTRSQVELFDRVRTRADNEVYVSESYHRGCMQVRNKYMVDKSAVCIAYLREKTGGTYNTVTYALKKGRQVINLTDVPLTDQISFDF
ncbi:MAG: DUF1273 domain-containing protein [Ruminococcaceae bacterium]|nr:DUF1273 domain-containing protein [Oscillospiraceae bacterium]